MQYMINCARGSAAAIVVWSVDCMGPMDYTKYTLQNSAREEATDAQGII